MYISKFYVDADITASTDMPFMPCTCYDMPTYNCRGSGERLFASATPTVKGVYNNDPHTLIRFDVLPPQGDDPTAEQVLLLLCCSFSCA